MPDSISARQRDGYLIMPWPDRSDHIAAYPREFAMLEEEDLRQVLLRHGSDQVYDQLRSLRPDALARALSEQPGLLAEIDTAKRRRRLLMSPAGSAKPPFLDILAWMLGGAGGASVLLLIYLQLKVVLSHA